MILNNGDELDLKLKFRIDDFAYTIFVSIDSEVFWMWEDGSFDSYMSKQQPGWQQTWGLRCSAQGCSSKTCRGNDLN